MRRGVKQPQKGTGSIRIISGRWRGRKLPVLDAEGLRPTTDRTKETLFNWLMPYVANRRCLDVFAGSGSLGLEALSRHAQSCVFIEKDKQAAQQLQNNFQLLKLPANEAQLHHGDALQLLSNLPVPFDLVFLDPPFHKNLLPGVIQSLEQNQLLATGGLVYIEAELTASNYAVPASWKCIKQSQTQQLSYRLYQKSE